MAKKAEGRGFEQLKNDLKNKQPARCYVLYGEEDYLLHYYFAALRKQIVDPLTEDFNAHHLTEETINMQLLSDCVEALPMMAERSFIHVDDVDLFAMPEGEREQLMQILDQLPDYCCLVFTYGATEFAPDARQKLYKTLEKNAVFAEFGYQSESDLKAWIQRHFRANSKVIRPELCTYLMGRCGVSMTRLDGEIEKICAYSGAQEIVREDIDSVVEPTLEAAVYDITDAMVRRDFAQAIDRLQTVLKMGEIPVKLLATIGTQMRRLNSARILLGEGKGARELQKICDIKSSYAVDKTMKQARRLSDRFCEQAVLLCRDTDYKMKTSYDEPQRLLEMLVCALGEVARND